MGTLFWVLVGLAIGWNFPQPLYAKYIQERLVAWWHSLWANK